MGEIFIRTVGVWHSGCFPKNMTMTQLNDVCVKLGFTKIYSSHMYVPGLLMNISSKRPIINKFSMVFIQKGVNGLKFPMRNGDEPYVSFVNDTNCNKLFIECK